MSDTSAQVLFPDSQAPRTTLTAGVLALLLSLALFMIIPLSKLLAPRVETNLLVRETSLVTLAPPKVPPLPTTQQEEPPPQPEYEPPAPELSLQQLQLSLQPGASDAMGVNVPLGGFDGNVDLVQEMEKILSFEELQQPPRLVYAPTINYPAQLYRQGIRQGTVEMLILIDEEGRVSVERVLSTTHPAFEELARRVAERSRFSVTCVDDKAVKVRGRWPLVIQQD